MSSIIRGIAGRARILEVASAAARDLRSLRFLIISWRAARTFSLSTITVRKYFIQALRLRDAERGGAVALKALRTCFATLGSASRIFCKAALFRLF